MFRLQFPQFVVNINVDITVSTDVVFSSVCMVLLEPTFRSQNLLRACVVVHSVAVTHQSGEVAAYFFDTGHDDAATGVNGELLKTMLCTKQTHTQQTVFHSS